MTYLEVFYQTLARSMPEWLAYLIPFLVGSIVVLGFLLTTVMVFIYMERRVLGRFQIRQGPNRTGPKGLLQPVADAIKVLTKEDIVPLPGDKVAHFIAPILVFIPTLLIFAVIPFQNGALLADLNIGVMYVAAVGTISVIGAFVAGWGSNNKYSLISAIRAVAQMVSYEVPLMLSMVGVVLIAGSLSLNSIVEKQHIPFIFLQPLGFFIFLAGSLAEINRTPFDLLEADSEIVAGFHTEYSGMKFALFFLGEYAHAVVTSALISVFFLSGWKGFPGLPIFVWFLIKIGLVFTGIIWIRSTLPRFRVDQLMGFAWKFLFPAALVNIFITGLEAMVWPGFPWFVVIINWIVAGAVVASGSLLFVTGKGRILEIQGAKPEGRSLIEAR